MRGVYQTKFGADWRDENAGDCLSAAIASVLELPLSEVPHFVREPDDVWFEKMQAWLAERNLYMVTIPADAPGFRPRGYHLINGTSPSGPYGHTVVGYDGEIEFDPNPAGGGLAKISTYHIFASLLVAAAIATQDAGTPTP